MADQRRSGGVQSIARAFTLLELVAANGGVMGLSQLSQESGFPLPTIHRLVRTLVDLGYLRQEPSRRYALGPRLLLLADSSETMLNHVAIPHLRRVVDSAGETTNLAMLDGDQVAYVAQAPGSHSMRMFTEVGRRVSPHCTAVGKALLGESSETEIRELLARGGMERHTPHTLTDPDEFIAQVAQCRERGYALDEGEQEVGVRCVAVVVPSTSTRLAVSMSGPVPRMSDELVESAVPVLTKAAAALAADLG
ncbi:IclR family transcriptional regulator [Solicola gregarius]|uniref:Glycerol operon regulatory protein n=1 Tax=Solicola gregarius TaxID=2908642 RepID=A0AA46TJ38_9ACTN|nr:IclR family transcriptional regulator [Solicola gregarius]UYM05809.1 IclR family transcriptional regulator [Solicola gregarius]